MIRSELTKKNLIFALAVIIPYLLGTVWHCLHPFVSILTGQTQPRRWYIDENSLDPGHFRMENNYHVITRKSNIHTDLLQDESICLAIQKRDLKIPCHKYISPIYDIANFDILKIIPRSNAVSPSSESIVLVIPWSINLTNTDIRQQKELDLHVLQLRLSIISLIRNLVDAPWLAKTILIVSPSTSGSASLGTTVDSFLSTYVGRTALSENNRHLQNKFNLYELSNLSTSIPSIFQGSIVRNLIVLDFKFLSDKDSIIDDYGNELRILPSGYHGSLPNMDLTFVSKYVYSHATFLQSTNNNPGRIKTNLVMHPYLQNVQKLSRYFDRLHFQSYKLPQHVQNKLSKLMDMLAFEYSMTVSSYPPHATAIDLGIDALTIQSALVAPWYRNNKSKDINENMAELIQKMEYLLRSLSNLHERLHHSTSLYLLPSTENFVKHEEYLIPNLLLLIPLLTRSILLLCMEVRRIDLKAIGKALAFTLTGTSIVSGIGSIKSLIFLFRSLWSFMAFYLIMIMLLRQLFYPVSSRPDSSSRRNEAKTSVQFVACLLGLLVNLALAFGHVSLSFLSSLFWVPFLSFPTYGKSVNTTTENDNNKGNVNTIAQYSAYSLLTKASLCILSLTPILLCNHVSFSNYFCYGVIPLHLIFCVLQLL